jgi:hypothetical protein
MLRNRAGLAPDPYYHHPSLIPLEPTVDFPTADDERALFPLGQMSDQITPAAWEDQEQNEED